MTDAITPLDGRNRSKLRSLIPYFSEEAINKHRILIEINYLEKLSEYKAIPKLSKQDVHLINQMYINFDTQEHRKIKKIEETTNHDVKAVEYYLRGKFIKSGLKKLSPFIHIGLTSDDVNNLSYALILKETNGHLVIPLLEEILTILKKFAREEKATVFLGRTHGQPAVPTTVGKEFANYGYRLGKQLKKLKYFSLEGKCNGAVGNFNALSFVFPKIDWVKFSRNFISSFGLTPNMLTSQILFYDNWLEYFQIIELINGILYDLCINIWLYIMLEIFVQKKVGKEVGSSTMPQKINPINFEHCEGSVQLANSLIELYERKLISSRLQRDLSDSTVRRTFAEVFGYSILGWQSIASGLSKISVNYGHINQELSNHWEVLAEAIQVYLRSQKDEKAYEKIKSLTRGKQFNRESYLIILKKLGLDKDKKFTELTPEKYVGLAKELINLLLHNN